MAGMKRIKTSLFGLFAGMTALWLVAEAPALAAAKGVFQWRHLLVQYTGLRELDLLKVRSRDVLEHIERVVHHVRRLEQSTETAVQMHFSVQSNRTNDIMRTLTALTAVFLPLNLIAGIFGMNFEFIPLVHKADGFWWAMAAMGLISITLVALFWRKRYLARTGQG